MRDMPGCVIMASGLGRRFGGGKLLAPLGGTPLIRWVLEAAGDLFPRRVVVTRSPGVAALCQEAGHAVVLHGLPLRSDTVRLGLEALGEDLTGCLFCQGDQPLVSRESLMELARRARLEPEKIWRLAWGDMAGAPVLFPRWAFPLLRSLPRGKGGGAVLTQYPQLVGLVPAQNPWELWDVDVPEDLERLAERLPPRCPGTAPHTS